MTAAAGAAAATVMVVAATGIEARALRHHLRGRSGVTVVRTGVGVAPPRRDGATVISCGLAGGLDPSLHSGTVVIPDTIVTAGGTLTCDPALVERLRRAARRRGVEPHHGPLVTVDHVVAGAERGRLAAQGYAAVDMESGLIGGATGPVAAVRIVLDTADRELSAAWANPVRALLRPSLWGEGLWLGRTAPRLCGVVAAIIAATL